MCLLCEHCKVLSGDGEVVAVMREGSLFGEVCQIYDCILQVRFARHNGCSHQVNLVHDVPCGGTVTAKTHCDLLLLSKKNIIQIMQHFPESEAYNTPSHLTSTFLPLSVC